jgi:hypothetical protein
MVIHRNSCAVRRKHQQCFTDSSRRLQPPRPLLASREWRPLLSLLLDETARRHHPQALKALAALRLRTAT